ncbi:MAG: hypothetical protein ACTSWL_06165, partial [Promethearchaeota archaeon]
LYLVLRGLAPGKNVEYNKKKIEELILKELQTSLGDHNSSPVYVRIYEKFSASNQPLDNFLQITKKNEILLQN